MKLKTSKTDFFKASVEYLCHVVSQNGVETDPDKIESLVSWPEPHNVKPLGTFLGFTGYFRRFVRDYVKIEKPLNDLLVGYSTNKDAAQKKLKTKDVVPWQWGIA